MTKKEKVAKVYPEKVRRGFLGGVCGCPDDYPFFRNEGRKHNRMCPQKKTKYGFRLQEMLERGIQRREKVAETAHG